MNVYERKCKHQTKLTIKHNGYDAVSFKLDRYFIYIKIFIKRSINFLSNLYMYKFAKKLQAKDISEAIKLIIAVGPR